MFLNVCYSLGGFHLLFIVHSHWLQILMSVTSRRYAIRAWAATAIICLGIMSVDAREEPSSHYNLEVSL